jgi:hypothetical protein
MKDKTAAQQKLDAAKAKYEELKARWKWLPPKQAQNKR